MSLATGTRLGPYEILAAAGAGGMGEVYRARDTRLGRIVAIKVLPGGAGGDADLRARQEREARAISSLNHPNICALYDVGSEGAIDFLVMEYLEGESLADRLARGPLSIDGMFHCCLPIAAALEAAHQSGILHRDLKPGNVQVSPEGHVKLLDFGLAKVLGSPPHSQNNTSSPTQLDVRTRNGALIGTPAYMSPEQVRGQPADERADIWAIGCIIYEALSGRPAFARATTGDTVAAVLEHDPDWKAVPSSTPPAIVALTKGCLEKDRHRRIGRATEVRSLLEGELARLRRQPDRPSRSAATILAWAVGLLILAGVLFLALRPRGDDAPAGRLAAPQLQQLTFAKGVEEFPAWSPDGRRLVYSAGSGGIRKLYLRSMADGQERELTAGRQDEIMPAWSPDGSTVLFVRARRAGDRLEPADVFGQYQEGDVWSLDIATGEEARLLEKAFNPMFAPDGRRIAVDASWVGARRIWAVDERGRNPVQITTDTSEAVGHVRPRWSPDGGRIVFQNIERTRFDVRIADLSGGPPIWITNDHFLDLDPIWAPDGRSVYFSSARSGGLNVWRMEVGPDGRPVGRMQQLTSGAGQDVQLAIAPQGDRLAFAELKQNADLWLLPVAVASGEPLGPAREVIATTREDSRGAWSPDGRRIAFNSDRSGSMNIWIHDLETGGTRQLTTGFGGDFQPNWSPDGRQVAFFSSRAGNVDIWSADAGTGQIRQLTGDPATDVNPFYSPDGRSIAFHSDREGRMEVWRMDADGSAQTPLTRDGVTLSHFMRFSADGRYVMFLCLCGGEPQVMQVPAAGGALEPVAAVAGGGHLSLSPDATLVLDAVGHKSLWVSPQQGGEPYPIFEFDDPAVRLDYPVWSPDGRNILFDRFFPEGGDIWVMTLSGSLFQQ
jgi:Tol biopolymer transport system component